MSQLEQDFNGLPGGDLVRKGLQDLAACRTSEYALLVLLAKPRLAALGLAIPEPNPPVQGMVSHALYDYLCAHSGDDAFSRYNSLVRRVTSFARALEREQSREGADKPAPG